MERKVAGIKIKIGIADDHELFSSALSHVLQLQPEYHISYTAKDGEEVLALINERNTDVLITDLSMPGIDGFQVIRKVREEHPKIKVIAVSMFQDHETVMKCIHLGAHSFVPKSIPIHDLKIAIKKVLASGIYFDEFVTRIIHGKVTEMTKKDEVFVSSGIQLSDFEKTFIRLICLQKERNEIISELNISERTYNTHKAGIQKKVSAKNAQGLVLFAVRYGLFKY